MEVNLTGRSMLSKPAKQYVTPSNSVKFAGSLRLLICLFSKWVNCSIFSTPSAISIVLPLVLSKASFLIALTVGGI